MRGALGNLDIQVSGDVGFGRSLQHIAGSVGKDGKLVAYTVRVTNVYRKIGDKWLIVQEHASLPLDRNTFTPLLDSSHACS